jgi:hypothetical protein
MASRITSLFDGYMEADAARTRLLEANVDAERIQVIDQNRTEDEGGDFWNSIGAVLIPSQQREAYKEAMRRGGYLLCVEVEEEQADEVVRIIGGSGAVDLEARQRQWREEGWQQSWAQDTSEPTGQA